MSKRYYRKYLILAITGSVIIGLAFYLLLNNYLDKKEIIVASRNINAGEKVGEGDVEFKEYYNNSLPENYLTDKEEVAGKVINIERRKDDYISSDMFDEAKAESGILDYLSDGDVLVTVNVQYTEPILEELKAGNFISIVSTVYDKDLMYVDYRGISGNGNVNSINNSISFNQAGGQNGQKKEDNKEDDENYSSGEDTDSKNISSENISNKDASSADINNSEASSGNMNSGNTSSRNNYFSIEGDYIDNVTFKLSENIMLVNGQVIVRNLEIMYIEKDVLNNDKNNFLGNSVITSIYLKCDIKEAPFIAKLTKNDDYKIIVEDI